MRDEGGLLGPEPLESTHGVTGFDCGDRVLNDYLSKQALPDQRADKSRTYVVCDGQRVVGYFTVSAASVEAEAATTRARKGQGRHPVPVVLIARLAVDVGHQGLGLGEALLLEALAKADAAADLIGARAVLVHAKGTEVVSFYERYGFEPSPIEGLHLMLLMKDVRRTLGERD